MENHEPKKTTITGVLKKIAWGTLIVGAGIAVAAVVGMIFFPAATRNLIDAVATYISPTSGKEAVENVLGKFDLTQVNEASKAVSTAGDEVVKTSKDLAVDKVGRGFWSRTGSYLYSWIPFVPDNAINNASNAASALANNKEVLEKATQVAIEKSDGLTHLITHHKVLAGAAAALGGYAVYNAATAPDKEAEESDYKARQNEFHESFAMKEDMRRMQARMALQAAAAGHPGAQAFMAQGA